MSNPAPSIQGQAFTQTSLGTSKLQPVGPVTTMTPQNVKLIYAARAICTCGQKIASLDGKEWACVRIIVNDNPTPCCQKIEGKKIYAEGDPDMPIKDRKDYE